VQPWRADQRQTPMKVRAMHASGRRWLAAVVLVTVAGCARAGGVSGSASDLSGVQSSPVATPSASVSSVGNGSVTGVVRTYGGPLMPNGQMADDGALGVGVTVTAAQSGNAVALVVTGSDGSYSFSLPPGTYVVKGCSSATVVVVEGQVVHQDLRCDYP
jgi:hypothetical protein